MNVGIDLGRKEIKIVRLDKSGDQFKLVDYGAKEVMEGAKVFDPEQIKQTHTVAALSSLMDEMDINPKRVKNLVSSMSGRHVNMKEIKMVEMPSDEIESSLQFEARKHIPLDGTDAIMDYQILGEDPKELDKVNVLLVASTKKTLEQHLDTLKNTKLKPGLVDSDPLAITNAYVAKNPLPENGVLVLLNIGALSTTIVVWGRGQQYFSREINIAGHHFTKAVMDKANVDYQEAERLKIEKGVNQFQTKSSGETGESSSFSIEVADRSIFDEFVEELRRSLRYYAKQTNQSFFQKILLTGGSASLPGLTEFISEKLNVPVEMYNPTLQLGSETISSIENPWKYSVAIGLALRGNN